MTSKTTVLHTPFCLPCRVPGPMVVKTVEVAVYGRCHELTCDRCGRLVALLPVDPSLVREGPKGSR